MNAGYPFPATRTRSSDRLDTLGLLAFATAPVVALYQGVTASLGILIPMSELVATLIPLVVIGVCLVARLPHLGQRLHSPFARRALIYLVGFLVTILVSTLLVYVDPIERDPAKMLQQFATCAAAIAVFVVMLAAPSPQSATRAMQVSLLIWAVAAILTPLTALTPFPIGELQGDYAYSQGLRVFGVLGDGGTFVVSCLAVAFLISRRPFWLALAIFALILSGSRSAVVVAAAGLAMAFVLATPNVRAATPGSRAVRVMFAALGAIGSLVLLQVVFGTVSEQLGFLNAFERLGETQLSETDRFFSIEQGLEWFQLSPIYGNGFNSYYYFSLRSAVFGANQTNALNQIVQTLVEGGLVGLLFLGLFFVEAIRPRGGPLVDRLRDPFGFRIWLLAFVLLNQTAVYILPASYLTVLIFGVCGFLVHAREWPARPPLHPGSPRHSQPRRIP